MRAISRSQTAAATHSRYDAAVFFFWALPAYIVCEVVSAFWQIRMATRMHADDEAAAAAAAAAAIDPDSVDAVRRRAKSDGGGGDPLEALTAVLYTRLVYVAFFIQVRLLGQIPYVGRAASLVLSALIHSCAAAASRAPAPAAATLTPPRAATQVRLL